MGRSSGWMSKAKKHHESAFATPHGQFEGVATGKATATLKRDGRTRGNCNVYGSSPDEIHAIEDLRKPHHHPSHSLLEEGGFSMALYSYWSKRCTAERRRKGVGQSTEMNSLFRFWSYHLRRSFEADMYRSFRALAMEDAEGGSMYGVECLFRFYSYGLEQSFRADLYKEFEALTLRDYMNGSLYGLEKLWAFRKYHGIPVEAAVQADPQLMGLLDSQYSSLEAFRKAGKVRCQRWAPQAPDAGAKARSPPGTGEDGSTALAPPSAAWQASGWDCSLMAPGSGPARSLSRASSSVVDAGGGVVLGAVGEWDAVEFVPSQTCIAACAAQRPAPEGEARRGAEEVRLSLRPAAAVPEGGQAAIAVAVEVVLEVRASGQQQECGQDGSGMEDSAQSARSMSAGSDELCASLESSVECQLQPQPQLPKKGQARKAMGTSAAVPRGGPEAAGPAAAGGKPGGLKPQEAGECAEEGEAKVRMGKQGSSKGSAPDSAEPRRGKKKPAQAPAPEAGKDAQIASLKQALAERERQLRGSKKQIQRMGVDLCNAQQQLQVLHAELAVAQSELHSLRSQLQEWTDVCGFVSCEPGGRADGDCAEAGGGAGMDVTMDAV